MQLQAPLNLDFLHAAVLCLALNIVSWHKEPLVRVVLLYAGVADLAFSLPHI